MYIKIFLKTRTIKSQNTEEKISPITASLAQNLLENASASIANKGQSHTI